MENNFKYRYVYKITCLKGSLSGHYYFGQHKTNNLNDGYTGSGIKITNYFKHYSKVDGETYIKEIIGFYNSDDELNNAEYQFIGDKYFTDPLCLNLCAGGNVCTPSLETRQKISKKIKGLKRSEEQIEKIKKAAKKRFLDYPYLYDIVKENGIKNINKLVSYTKTEENKNRVIKMNYKRFESEIEREKVRESNRRRTISEESKEKNRQSQLKRYETYIPSTETRKKYSDACKNKFWIHLDNKTKRISEEYLNYWLDDGWFFGRGGIK